MQETTNQFLALRTGTSTPLPRHTKAYLSATVYVEDVNDHDPVFIDAPYEVNVDELTPTGLTVFRGVQAVDMDKPNTPNSELIYTLTAGNPDGRFSLEMTGQRPALVLKKTIVVTSPKQFPVLCRCYVYENTCLRYDLFGSTFSRDPIRQFHSLL
ncbi:unnamed protein product [Nezara viridula]|uniref:Cadherin domain-containing protein n=1 Tax=Nezara viridula TaxID=85310 RepID=A0A9P0HE02_NEZVI|nr:unnamed protein product [Nezara viridula]